MKPVKVAAGVLNQTPLDWSGNRERIVGAIAEARDRSASILCLPELCLTGYGCEDAFLSPGLQRTAQEVLESLLPETRNMVVSVGLPLMHGGGLFNVAALLVNGHLAGCVAKQHLAGDGIHYEPRWFKPWPEHFHARTRLFGREYPLGDLLFDVGGIRIGFEICEDAWVGSRPGSSLAERGADVILNPSASHFAFGKHAIRRRFVLEGSRAFQVAYIYANQLGNESGRAIYDGDAMIATGGELVANGPRFSYQPFRVTSAVIDIDANRRLRTQLGSFEPDFDGDESDVVACDWEVPAAKLESTSIEPPRWERSDDIRFEEFTRAVSLGLFDYVRKSRSRGFVLSLSGGADSASCAVLVHTLAQFAMGELGGTAVAQRLGGGLASPDLQSPRDVVNRLLTTVYQSTRNSGEVTRTAARELAESLGAIHYEFDVDDIVQRYTDLVGAAIGTPLNWEDHDIALQNIQSRVRAPGVWMLANLRQALLISTSNRSEAAVGYATMDGDTSGGLSPIAGIDKAFLRRWLVWMEQAGPDGLDPLPVLELINRQAPTAELRPASSHQTDEGDLMPYDVLDRIERLAIGDKLVPAEVLEHLVIDYPDEPREQLLAWTKKFFRLWSRNQWKRERYAPSFHLDDKNLDPKTWCRFPILSGGFEDELAELE